jgi:hypothetical protein
MTTKLHNKVQGQRVHKLASLGGLVAIAKLEDIDPAVLLGTFLGIALQLPQVSILEMEVLREIGLQKLRDRNTEKRIFKRLQETEHDQSEIVLNKEDIKKIIIKLGGRVPVFERDIIPELLRLVR